MNENSRNSSNEGADENKLDSLSIPLNRSIIEEDSTSYLLLDSQNPNIQYADDPQEETPLTLDSIISPVELDETLKENEEEKPIIGYRFSNLRWLALALVCGLEMGIEFGFSSINIMEDELKSRFKIEDTGFNLLFSIYNLPNIVMPLVGGYLIDRIGVKLSLFIFLSVVVGGQLFFAIAIVSGNYAIALTARCISGLTGPSIYVAASVIVTRWFKFKYLAIAMGLANLGTSTADITNDYLTPVIYNSSGDVSLPFWVGFILAVFSFLCGIGTIFLERKAEIMDTKDGYNIKDESERFQILDILQFGLEFWIFMTAFFFVHLCFGPFFSSAGDLFPKRFNVSNNQTGYLFSISDFMSLGLPILFGFLIDFIGRRTIIFSTLSLVLIISQLYFALVPTTDSFAIPCFGMIIFGLGYSAFWVTVYPCVAQIILWKKQFYYYYFPTVVQVELCFYRLLVLARTVGSAFGLAYALDSLGSAAGTYIVGVIHDHTKENKSGYFWVCIFIAILVFIGFIVSIILLIYDLYHGKRLYNVKVKEDPKIKKERDENTDILFSSEN